MPTFYFTRFRALGPRFFNDVFALDTQTGILTQVSTNPRGGRYYDTARFRLNSSGSDALYTDTFGHPADKCGLFTAPVNSTGFPPMGVEFPAAGDFPYSADWCNGDLDIVCATTHALVVINRESRNATTLRTGVDSFFSVSASPDGQRIAYVEELGAFSSNLYVCALDGSGQQVLSQVGVNGEYGMPAWSPDGSEIAYPLRVREGDGAVTSLNAVRVDGAIHRTLLPPDPLHLLDPVWAQGGIYLTVTEAGSQEQRGSIFYRSDTGGDLIRVTTAPPGEYGMDSPSCWRA